MAHPPKACLCEEPAVDRISKSYSRMRHVVSRKLLSSQGMAHPSQDIEARQKGRHLHLPRQHVTPKHRVKSDQPGHVSASPDPALYQPERRFCGN